MTPYRTSDYLDSDEAIIAYAEEVLRDGDAALIELALTNIVEALRKKLQPSHRSPVKAKAASGAAGTLF